MATIDASTLSPKALKALQKGESVALKSAGKTIATVRAQSARPAVDPMHELVVLRAADKDDDWQDYLDWPDR